ncbi:hypothetical protein [Hyphomonas johnsonii]|jgi:hypothetical protein|uniref:Uncharacterized protein n=1 Tax=Hyphomonas johnsonii MHS-2 TaxID=1280950 RepID=A0A059FCW5_9PROT|nr:hypothetical protein [Hyphomonas johnsonii]KCZ88373.1 hypothetical protein HJO_15963 [Hyphomonas johnsonii MHS-2]
MNRLLDFISRTPVLIGSFILMIVVAAGFVWARGFMDGTFLDLEMSGPAAMQRLSEMTPDQRNVQFWTTLVLDTLFPLAYGGFFGGLAARFGGSRRLLATLPMLLGVGFDFAENITQVLAVKGFDSLLAAKTFLTPVKFGLVDIGIVIGIVLALMALVRHLLKPRAA